MKIDKEKKKEVGIVGFGRFGQVMYKLLKNDFNVVVYNRTKSKVKNFSQKVTLVETEKDFYKQVQTVFYCVSISSFKTVLSKHKKYFKNHLLIDTCSVKIHPKNVFEKILKDQPKVQALLTHPMFGPDSTKNGFDNLPIVLDKFRTDKKNYIYWKDYFKKKNLRIVEITANQHDKMAAKSQGIAHFIGRLLADMKFEKTSIDTLGAKKLNEIMDQTCNDTWELFENLQNYNPYTKKMRLNLGKAYNNVYKNLLPERINNKYIVYGIQGGKGSFNEEALMYYLRKHNIKNYKIKYLYTTKKVLKSLHKGEVDYGQFAIQNSIGGVVEESISAMAEYRFKIKEQFAIKIRHFIMKRKDVFKKNINVLMSHPQVFKQCKNTLNKKYSKMKKITGKGDLITHDEVARQLVSGKINKETAVIGPKVLSTLYDLEIMDKDLQDDKTNFTDFLIVKRN